MYSKKDIIGMVGFAAAFDPINEQQKFIQDIREERQERLENKFFGTLKPKPGHKLYKYNYSTHKLFELADEDYFDSELVVQKKLKPVQLVSDQGEKTTFREQRGKHLKREGKTIVNISRKIRIEINTYYFSALNETNAVKHIKKIFNL